ncbi:hypothetical protein CRG98_028229 [Punica granatum]|uniref:Retrovirus-related Pol polyprotein from transposon TNT 1-94 n=1 Tax=Punica granatum TaxID=22663 RepID=A0A2I0J558_PUNGR|nr:hypothetical protein CRG98_028229 [Punica granatum]
MWKKLESLYLQKSLTNMLYLKQRLYQLRLGLGTSVGDHMDLFNQIVIDLVNVDVKIECEDQALLLLCSLSKSYESFVDTIVYERTNITLEDVNASLNSNELHKKVTSNQGSMVRDLSQQVDRLRRGLKAGSLDALGYKYMGQGGVSKVSKEALVGMKGVLQDELYVLQGKADTMTTFERSTPKEK